MRGQIITGSSVSVQIGIENTVTKLKTKLAAALQENVDMFRLMYNGQCLKLTDQLCHYNLADNAAVYITMKMGHVCGAICQTSGTRYFHAPPPYHADPEK